MILKISNPAKTYTVHFHHQYVGGIESNGKMSSPPVDPEAEKRRWNWITTVTMHPTPCASKQRPCHTPGEITAQAKCSKSDTFTRASGRKIAFGRLIQHFTREQRRELWTAYFADLERVRQRKPRPSGLPAPNDHQGNAG